MSNNAYKARTRRSELLSKVSLSELKAIRIAVRRSNITVQGPPTPIVRSIDDPKQLVPLVHIKTGNESSSTSIFDRPEIQVNQEERLILADANRLEPNFSPASKSSTRSRSRTPARRSKISTVNERANDSPRTGSIERRSRSCEKRSKSRERRNRSTERRSQERPSSSEERRSRSNEKTSRSRRRRSRSRDRRSRSKEKRDMSRERSRSREGRNDDKYGRDVREKDSLYRPRRQSSQDNRERKGKGRSVDRPKGEDKPLERISRSRERSRDRGKSKDRFIPKRKNKERDTFFSSRRSPTALRPGEYIPGHPDLKTRSRSRGRSDRIRRSKSASRDRYQPSSSSRRSRSPRYERPSTRRTSHSPRRSRSPTGYSGRRTRDRSGEKRRSVSHMRERNRSESPRSSPSKHSRRGSRSPGGPRGRYRPPVDPRSSRSRSPHPPVVTFDRPAATRRRRSRSPDRDRRRRGSRSPARRGDGYGAGALAPPALDYGYYEGVPGADFWIPTPLRSGFSAMPRFYPPPYFPRGFPPGAPIIFRPRYPMMCPPNLHRPMYHRNRIRPAAETSNSIGEESAIAAVTAPVTAGEVTVQEVEEAKKTEDTDKEIEMSSVK